MPSLREQEGDMLHLCWKNSVASCWNPSVQRSQHLVFVNDVYECEIVTGGTKVEMDPKVHDIIFSKYRTGGFTSGANFAM